MNYTKNHHLPQWVKDDRIMMDDFNAAMSSIESGLNTISSKASAAQSAANSAKSAASTAQSAANAAQSTANSALSSKPYATGSYTGTGVDMTFNVGFRPSFLIVTGLKEAISITGIDNYGAYSCMTSGDGAMQERVKFTATGFRLCYCNSQYPRLVDNGRSYEYIVFK